MLSTSVIMIIICSTTALGFYMVWERIPINLISALTIYLTDPTFLLLTVNLFIILVGMFVEISASLILHTPLFGADHCIGRSGSGIFWNRHRAEFDHCWGHFSARHIDVYHLLNRRSAGTPI